jgi:hypothetical protein
LGTANIIIDPVNTGSSFYVCVQQGWSPGFNCAVATELLADMQTEAKRFTYKSSKPKYYPKTGVEDASFPTDFEDAKCSDNYN